MVFKRKIAQGINEFINELIQPKRLEAPDEKYIGQRDILTRSMARYQFVSSYIHGNCLEVGCGRAYGLEKYKSNVVEWIGLDITQDFIKQAKIYYPDHSFVQANGNILPFRANIFDTIISFEVIEHIDDDLAYLIELRRLVHDNSIVALSTPNRLVVSGNSYTPIDRFHVREYLYDEFRELLESVFSNITIYGQYEAVANHSIADKALNRIPIRFRSMFPSYFQNRLSVLLRSPLRMSDISFSTDELNFASNFVAICRP